MGTSTTNIPLAAFIQCEGAPMVRAELTSSASNVVGFWFGISDEEFAIKKKAFYAGAGQVAAYQYSQALSSLRKVARQILEDEHNDSPGRKG